MKNVPSSLAVQNAHTHTTFVCMHATILSQEESIIHFSSKQTNERFQQSKLSLLLLLLNTVFRRCRYCSFINDHLLETGKRRRLRYLRVGRQAGRHLRTTLVKKQTDNIDLYVPKSSLNRPLRWETIHNNTLLTYLKTINSKIRRKKFPKCHFDQECICSSRST